LIAIYNGNEGVSFQLFGGGDDSYFYLEQARNVANGREAVLTSVHPFILGKITQILGFESVYVFRIFNYLGYLFLVATSLLLLKKLYQYDPDIPDLRNSKYFNSCILLMLFYMLYPSLIMYVTLSIFRDVWIYALYIFCLLIYVRLIHHKNIVYKAGYLVFLFFSLALLGLYRDYAALSFVLSCGVIFLYDVFKKLRVNIYGLFFVLLSAFIVYYSYFKEWKVPYVDMSLLDVLLYRENSLDVGGSQMNISLAHESNIIFFMIHYVESYLGNLVGPLVWHTNNLPMIVVFCFESIPFLLILYVLYRKRLMFSFYDKVLLTHSFVWNALISISNDNIGTATRLRVVGWLVILIVFVKIVYKKEKTGKGRGALKSAS
jgi:hypothetical protein